MPNPSIPEVVPRRSGRTSRRCWQFLTRLLGWEFEGELPNLSRFVLIGAPHTSNWDFVIAMSVMGGLGLRITWLGKHTLFRWPLGAFLRRLGGIPVDRRRAHGFVGHATEAFRTEERLVVGIAPEGTRKRTEHWKMGFYHIAVGAGVPIVPAYLDYRRRRVGMGMPLIPTNDVDGDLKKLKDFYAPYARAAKRPERYGQG